MADRRSFVHGHGKLHVEPRSSAWQVRSSRRNRVQRQQLDVYLQRPATGAQGVVGRAARTARAAFLEVFVHSTLWMSFSLASLVLFIQLECGGVGELDIRPFWAGASESVAVYTLDHLRDLSKSKARGDGAGVPRYRTRLLRALFTASLVGFVASVAAMRSWRVLAILSGHLALCFTYAKLKRRMPYMKAVYVSLCVVYMAAAAPAAYSPGLLAAPGAAALARLLLLIFGISFTIENLQDMRDIREDRAVGIVTLPSGLGVERTARVLLALQALAVVVHCGLAWAAALPLRLDLLLLYACCGLCTLYFQEHTPRSLFQVLLEPLYVAPLAVAAARTVLTKAALG